MPRVNVWLPDELHRALKDELPDVNLSQLVQEAIRGALGCTHEELACRRCAAPVDRYALRNEALDRFYVDVMWALGELVSRGGTAEGAARVLKDIARRQQIPAAAEMPLPRPTRAERHAARVKELPDLSERQAPTRREDIA